MVARLWGSQGPISSHAAPRLFTLSLFIPENTVSDSGHLSSLSMSLKGTPCSFRLHDGPDHAELELRSAYNTVLALDGASGKWGVEIFEKLPGGVQPQISPEELLACEKIVRDDPQVRKLAKDIGTSPPLFWDGRNRRMKLCVRRS